MTGGTRLRQLGDRFCVQFVQDLRFRPNMFEVEAEVEANLRVLCQDCCGSSGRFAACHRVTK
jgi:hypothetical protein